MATSHPGAAYIRVSTGKQEELSPDSQKRLILDYARCHDITIPEEYIFMENGISGRKADKRPQFQKMIALAKAGQFDVILLWKFSRFARNQEESIVYKSMLKKHNVDVVSISEPLADGPFGSLIERIIEWMDEFYSIRLASDVTRGMTEKALRGGYQCRPPLGYQIPYHNAAPQIIPKEAEIVRMIFDDYINQRLSVFQITKKLNAAGQLTGRGKSFEKRGVEYILANPCYAGYTRWNRTDHAANTVKNEEEWIVRPGRHEAIISTEWFEAARERKKSEAHTESRRPSETYKHWLGGLLKCSACGRTMTLSKRTNPDGTVYQSFQCCGYSKGKCSISHSVSAARVVPAVLEALQEAWDCGTHSCAAAAPLPPNNDSETKLLDKQLERLTQKEQRIKAAYADGIDSLAEYKANKSKLTLEREQVVNRLLTLSAINIKETPAISDLPSAATICNILRSDSFTAAQKNVALRSIVEKIVYHKSSDSIQVMYRFPPSG